MSVLVVDASVGAKWFFEEEYSTFSTALLDSRHQLHAPDFFRLELDSIICKRIRRCEIGVEEGQHVRDTLRVFPVQYHPVNVLDDAAFELANQTLKSPYDCVYLALALLLDGRMITADRRFYDTLREGSLGAYLCWVSDSL